MNPKLALWLLLATLITTIPAQAAPNYALLFNGRNNYVSATVPVLASNYTLSGWVNLRRGGLMAAAASGC